MEVYLVDGTYELFRHFFGVPSFLNSGGREVGATRGVVTSVIGMLESGITHIGVATDHVIESFRNDMWPGYKSSAGMDPTIVQQFPLLEEALQALGVVVWPMVEFEADDAMATAASLAAARTEVERVLICTPDKDLGQCVVGTRVVQLDRRHQRITDESGVIAKFGVLPESIPDYLALVGDSADGFPGLSGWGGKSAAIVLSRFPHLENVPLDARVWNVQLPSARADRLAAALKENRELAMLFRDLATLRTNAPIEASPESLRWTGPSTAFADICEELGAAGLMERVKRVKTKVE